jgi:hypothetical protein
MPPNAPADEQRAVPLGQDRVPIAFAGSHDQMLSQRPRRLLDLGTAKAPLLGAEQLPERRSQATASMLSRT